MRIISSALCADLALLMSCAAAEKTSRRGCRFEIAPADRRGRAPAPASTSIGVAPP
jgi:hypothetical protein